MSEKIAYCSLEPEFPAKAYLLYFFILHQDQLMGMVPLEPIFTLPAGASEAVQNMLNQFDTMKEVVTIPHECLLIPLTRHGLFPLRKEFWKKPALTYDYHARVKTFSGVSDHPSFYSLLVTPSVFDDMTKEWHLNAAIPLDTPEDTKTIEQFMFNSDYVVEPRAKHAGIYTMGEKIRFNWETQEMKPFDKTAKKILATQN